jgi:putative endonuclease
MSKFIGSDFERRAAHYLERRGYGILERNLRTPVGEIDLVAVDRGTLVFVEVKARGSGEWGLAREFVDRRKQRRLMRAASLYAAQRGFDQPMRFDVVAFEGAAMEHIEAAFWE